MQAFEFAKQVMLDFRRLRQDMQAANGDTVASEDRPIRLTAALGNVEYDDEVQPLKEITIELVYEGGPSPVTKSYTLEIPDTVHLFTPDEIDPWLESVLEFTATAHGMSLKKAEKDRQEAGEPPAPSEVFLDKDEWAVRWKVSEGQLSDIPVESAAVQLDTQAKRTLGGWKQSPTRWDDNPDDDEVYVEKSFKSPLQATVTGELMYQILLLNGHSEEELDENLRSERDEESGRMRLVMPESYIKAAQKAEMYMDF